MRKNIAGAFPTLETTDYTHHPAQARKNRPAFAGKFGAENDPLSGFPICYFLFLCRSNLRCFRYLCFLIFFLRHFVTLPIRSSKPSNAQTHVCRPANRTDPAHESTELSRNAADSKEFSCGFRGRHGRTIAMPTQGQAGRVGGQGGGGWRGGTGSSQSGSRIGLGCGRLRWGGAPKRPGKLGAYCAMYR